MVKAECEYLKPISYGTRQRIGVRNERIGTKSLTFGYAIETFESQQAMARWRTVSVAYDYHAQHSIPVPAAWRKAIESFESTG